MTSANDLIAYYQNLLILQYNNKPKALATIAATVTQLILAQADLTQPTLPTAILNGFNLLGDNIAVGAQLDILGKYLGVTRTGQGFSSNITLDDSDFLSLIRLATAVNYAGSSLSDIQAIIQQFFPGEMLVFDYKNMAMSYLISESVGSQDFIQLAVNEGLLPAPMAVGISSIIYAPTINNFFGFRTYTTPAYNASPFNSYANYTTNTPWLSYANAISF